MEKLGAPSGYSDTTESKMIQPGSVGRLIRCAHTFHLLCVLAMYTSGNKVQQARRRLAIVCLALEHQVWMPQ